MGGNSLVEELERGGEERRGKPTVGLVHILTGGERDETDKH